jgi:hypothetical protein
MAIGQVHGEIIGAEHREHAVRLVSQRHARVHRRVEPLLAGARRIGGDRDVDLGDHRFDFGARFPQRLAGLACEQVGKGVGLGADDIGEAPHRLDAKGERARRPFRPGFARRGDFLVGIAHGLPPQYGTRGGFGRDDFLSGHLV